MKYSQSKLKHKGFPLGITTSQVKLWAVQDSSGRITSINIELKSKVKEFKVKKLGFLEAFREAETFLNKNLVLTKIRAKNNSKNQA